MATMLQLVQQACSEMGLVVPTQVAGNTATDVVQILGLVNAVGYEISREFPWQALNKEYRFTTQYLITTGDVTNNSTEISNLASVTGLDSTYMVTGTGINQDTYVDTVDSGTQVSISLAANTTQTGVDLTFGKTKYAFPTDYDRPINRTNWDKTQHWEMLGPETPQQWQWLKSGYIATGPRVRYRAMGGFFQIWPIPGAAHVLGFEYVSKAWAYSSTGTAKNAFSADDDTCIFPDRLMVLGLKKKYFEIKGFDTTAFYRDYITQLDIAKANDAGAQTLSFAPRPNNILIGWENIPDSNYAQG